ncbi:histone-lysine N-methyltransferase, H3 lysine-9 specific SUVH6-like [Panicum hallii]|uniref:histone-lysine N-methyltransferase, H3 lysine-9 specific SUVH6-like n=1 Tax=Panicum hallii TaxID=206008 RepID=UPI000DF4DB09|nr:histone-lysine N-methyltransferase, H3 lysine-9 specific SUVH6-like [Panicum hallii]
MRRPSRETGGGAEAGSKRRLPLAPTPPPPKRRAVSARRQFPPGCGRHAAASLAGADAGSQLGDAGARGCSAVRESKDGALFGAATPSAAGTSALEKVSAAVADGPVAGSGHHVPEAGVVKSSSEALRRSDVAAPDGSLDIGSQGVPFVSVEGRGNGAGSAELGRKESVPAAPLQAEPMVSFAKRSFPPGCGKDAVLSVLVGRGIGEVRLPLESGVADGDLGVAEELVSTDGCISTVHGHDMEIVPPQSNDTIDGTLHDDGLEEGEILPEAVVQESQVSTSDTLQNSSACRHGSSAEICSSETSLMQSSNDKEGGNTLQCWEKRSSCLVEKEVEVMNVGSSCSGVVECPAEDSSKQNLMRTSVSEIASMNRASSDLAAGVSGNVTTMRSVAAHDSTTYRRGASVPELSAVDASMMQPSNEKTGGNILQCKEKGSSWLVAKDVEVMNQSIRSSSNIVAESLAKDSSKQDMLDKRVSESARMKVMFTPRKVVRPTKNVYKEETEHGRGVIINRIKDTVELTTDQVMQVQMSSNKYLMTQEKEAATTRGFFGPRKKVKVKAPAHLQMKIASTCALGSEGKLNDEVASNLDDDDVLKAVVVHEGKLELYLNNSSDLPSVRCQKQYGSQNADARRKFKMLCRRFEFVCRTLVQAVEQHSLKIRRIDLEADKVIRQLPDFIKHDPIVGQVPGVEVGDEFLYRVQLAIVGLHRVYQGGIDTTTHRNGERIAISIVASGGYPDELPCSGELIYTGSGGKPAGNKCVEDQKLERGNLALKNCIKTKTPVRVIHGFKGQNTEGGSHSRAKQISTFTYDGLYRVVDFWMHGRPGSRMFKYKLRKIPGQPELPMHIAKGMRKSKTRPGLCMVDISQGKEGTPICVINTVDDVQPTPFRYITRIKYPSGLTKIRHQGCDCTNGCSDSASCACAVKNGGEIPFNLNGAIVNEKPLIFECGPFCKCPPSCQNRVSQHGMKIPLEVFRTTKTGWGVRSLRSISSGCFICEYVGELLYGKEADKRKNSDYLFDIGLNCGDGLQSTVSGLNTSSSCSQIMEDVGFTVDAAEYGNIGRFINHSCSPNLYTQNVLWDHDDKRMPHIMFFAAETIPPLQELTYDYNYEIDHVQDANGRIKFKVCQCGSPQCSGRLY